MGILLEEIEVRLAYFVFHIARDSGTLFIDLDFILILLATASSLEVG